MVADKQGEIDKVAAEIAERARVAKVLAKEVEDLAKSLIAIRTEYRVAELSKTVERETIK